MVVVSLHSIVLLHSGVYFIIISYEITFAYFMVNVSEHDFFIQFVGNTFSSRFLPNYSYEKNTSTKYDHIHGDMKKYNFCNVY